MCYFENRSNTENIPKPIQQPHRKETEEMSIDRIQHVGTTDTIEEVTKFNPYHGSDGRFASAGGGGSAAGAAGAGGNKPSKAPKYGDALNTLFGSGENFAGGIPSVKTGKGEKGRAKAIKIIEEAKAKAKEYGKDPRAIGLERNGAGEYGVHYLEGNGYFKSYDTITEVEKANPYHGRDGRFTTASGRGAGATTAAGANIKSTVDELNNLPAARGVSKVKYEDIKAYDAVLTKLPAGTKLSHKMDAGTEIFEKVTDKGEFSEWRHTRQPWGITDNTTQFDIARFMAGRAVISRGAIEVMETAPASTKKSLDTIEHTGR